MKIAIISDPGTKEELPVTPPEKEVSVCWYASPQEIHDADVCVDLLFTPDARRIDSLQNLNAGLVLVNSVITPLSEIGKPFVRINAWPGFRKRNIIEAASLHETGRREAENIMRLFGKEVVWTPDVPGFISARVLAMLINEAFFALEENVSDAAEIDLAMKLGTNYPFGPFEWAQQIGLHHVYHLLCRLSREDNRYRPCPLLQQQCNPS
ncbi:MAG: 3-hydroxyacyl-CoA dehydrogenase family protein [Chitinophagaceae bacterium]|nr:3-hydroxyacyl-CoA dehydrogenase family protein [Chitinophagaceae bacterium]